MIGFLNLFPLSKSKLFFDLTIYSLKLQVKNKNKITQINTKPSVQKDEMNSSKTPQINQKPSDIASKPKSIVSKAKPKVKPAPKLSFDLKLKIIDDSKKK